jgi:hypothetical protein
LCYTHPYIHKSLRLTVALLLLRLLLPSHLCSCSAVPDGWHSHGFKARAMKAAWSGLVLHSNAELLRGGMSAFKANWREQQLQRALLAGCMGCWQGLARKYRAAAVMRQRIKQVRFKFSICLPQAVSSSVGSTRFTMQVLVTHAYVTTVSLSCELLNPLPTG